MIVARLIISCALITLSFIFTRYGMTDADPFSLVVGVAGILLAWEGGRLMGGVIADLLR